MTCVVYCSLAPRKDLMDSELAVAVSCTTLRLVYDMLAAKVNSSPWNAPDVLRLVFIDSAGHDLLDSIWSRGFLVSSTHAVIRGANLHRIHLEEVL